MHSENPYFPRIPPLPFGNQLGNYPQNYPTAPVVNGFAPRVIDPPLPFHRIDIQPSEACPRNLIIFDQTNNRSQIMFNPEMNSNLFYPGFGVDAPIFQSNVSQVHQNYDRKVPSSFTENSDDINALLSTEYVEIAECEGDEVSTARTNGMYECNSPDSYSNYKSPPCKSRSLFRKPSGSRSSDKRRQRMKKMVKALRRIVPGASRMSSVVVLDESVRYLKSLRVEVQKLGVGNTRV